ncbi:N-acetyltransferase eco isoform X1 [Drosophila subobscura]|uniref:N-acetyltransferase eco isoform X1 n=1 Tax=Drosophila subobscura TaxID=7241 RepID=UPI00155AF63E|nr:N-acetyltransferase eco isoform X1 [Drosophila subobscura]
METPKGSGYSTRPERTPTPRLSERKRQLFRSRSTNLDQFDDDEDVRILGISPLKPHASSKKPSQLKFDEEPAGRQLRSSTSSSPETNKENKKIRGGGEGVVVAATEQLPLLFNKTMCINSNSNSSSISSSPRTPRVKKSHVIISESDDDGGDDAAGNPIRRVATKRVHTTDTSAVAASSHDSDTVSPETKQRRTNPEGSIPTMAFYSHSATPSWTPKSGRSRQQKEQQQRSGKAKTSPTCRPRLGINKGVRHKIRKPNRLVPHQHLPPTDIDLLLGSLRNEKLKNLITKKREERAQVEQVHQILHSARDPIKMAKPLSVIAADDANNNMPEGTWQQTSDFSDLSEEEEEQSDPAVELEPIIPLIRHDAVTVSPPEPTDLSKRKFFKSGKKSGTCMEVRITDNIKASVSHGRISLIQPPVKKARRVRVKSATLFSAEQATVDAILRNLNDTVVDEIIESSEPEPKTTAAPIVAEEAAMNVEDAAMEVEEAPELVQESIVTESVQVHDQDSVPDPFARFRQRLPYNTDDPEIMEQQQILLEFLISNNICTDEYFEYFIGDPDSHKEEATRIVDQLYMVVQAEQSAQEAAIRSEAEAVMEEKPEVEMEKEREVEMEKEPEVEMQKVPEAVMEKEPEVEMQKEPAPKLFPIFTQRLQPVPQKTTRRKPGTSMRLQSAATGSNQYQIDAGQKAFGARQCQQCGLVYTVHEPEEEKLHREYHSSIHILRFKGWLDEDIVAVCPEWSNDGRIIRINERAPAVRLDRFKAIISVVDKELGYSSYIVPKEFYAFFAIQKQQIVGFCLVQPLAQAHRFVHVDGTDYFSEETYEASCGVSRIWVSPLHRRRGIASQLIRTVQSHTILGQKISMDRIAFSTPTDDGRALARCITRTDSFLTYDQ